MTLEEKIKCMRDYLLLKFEEEDYHAVSDAANDLREMIAVQKYKSQLKAEHRIEPIDKIDSNTLTIKNPENWSYT